MYNNDEWNGKLILGTDNVLEQYQNSMYAFFQGSGEIYVGGIVWSNDGKWIVSTYLLYYSLYNKYKFSIRGSRSIHR